MAAKVDIKMGDTITADMVEVKMIPPSQAAGLGGGYYTQVGQVASRVAGTNINQGSYLYTSSITQPGAPIEGESIASSLAKGMVGVAVDVDQINGVGTLIVPGDHVDVVLTVWVAQLQWKEMPLTGGKTTVTFGGGNDVSSKMVFQNRKVIRTLASTEAPVSGPQATAGPASSAQPSAETVAYSSNHMIVVLEVTPSEAEVVRWAQRAEKADGANSVSLGLALRSDEDNDSTTVVKTDGVTFKQLVDLWGVLPADARGTLPDDVRRKLSW